MNVFKELISKLMGFLTNTGLVWFGYLGGALAILFFLGANSWFEGTLFGGLLGAFLMKNFETIKAWAQSKL